MADTKQPCLQLEREIKQDKKRPELSAGRGFRGQFGDLEEPESPRRQMSWDEGEVSQIG